MPRGPLRGDGQHRDCEEDEGEGKLNIAQAHEHCIDPATEEAGDEADDEPHRAADEDRRHADHQRVAGAVDEAAEEIPSQGVGSERVGGGAALHPHRRLEVVAEVLDQGVVRRDERRQQRNQGDEREADDPDQRSLALEQRPCQVPAPARRPRRRWRDDAGLLPARLSGGKRRTVGGQPGPAGAST